MSHKMRENLQHMGEQEQSGLLKTVVVLGLIALIAGISIASLTVLRGKMDEKFNDVNNRIQAAVSNKGPLSPDDNLATANDKTPYLVRIADNNFVSGTTKVGDKWQIPDQWTSGDDIYNPGANVVVNSDGSMTNTNGHVYHKMTPLLIIPKAAKAVTITVSVKQIDGDKTIVQALYGSNSAATADWNTRSENDTIGEWTTDKLTVPVSDGHVLNQADYTRIGFDIMGVGRGSLKDAQITFS